MVKIILVYYHVMLVTKMTKRTKYKNSFTVIECCSNDIMLFMITVGSFNQIFELTNSMSVDYIILLFSQ